MSIRPASVSSLVDEDSDSRGLPWHLSQMLGARRQWSAQTQHASQCSQNIQFDVSTVFHQYSHPFAIHWSSRSGGSSLLRFEPTPLNALASSMFLFSFALCSFSSAFLSFSILLSSFRTFILSLSRSFSRPFSSFKRCASFFASLTSSDSAMIESVSNRVAYSTVGVTLVFALADPLSAKFLLLLNSITAWAISWRYSPRDKRREEGRGDSTVVFGFPMFR